MILIDILTAIEQFKKENIKDPRKIFLDKEQMREVLRLEDYYKYINVTERYPFKIMGMEVYIKNIDKLYLE